MLAAGTGDYNGATLSMARHGGTTAIDSFAANGLLVFDGTDVKWDGATVGTLSGDPGALSIAFNASATTNVVNWVLLNITYEYTGDDPPANVTIDLTFDSGGVGALGELVPPQSATASVVVDLTSVNDAPTLLATAISPTFTQGDTAALLFSGAAASTIEAGQSFTEMTVTVSGLADGANEQLVLGPVSIDLVDGATDTYFGTDRYLVSVTGTTATVTF